MWQLKKIASYRYTIVRIRLISTCITLYIILLYSGYIEKWFWPVSKAVAAIDGRRGGVVEADEEA